MGKLTREELLELKQYLDKTHGKRAVTNMQDVTNTALSLMDENDAMKAGIGELQNKYKIRRRKKEGYTSAIDDWDEGNIEGQITVYDKIIQDLSDITGVKR